MSFDTFREYLTSFIFLLICATTIIFAAKGFGKEAKPSATGKTCINSKCHHILGKKRYVHEPAKDGTMCMDCHVALQGNTHSFKLRAIGSELCGECHKDKADKEFVHSPVEEGYCTECHNPHQSENEMQLILPPSPDLCYECHEVQKFMGNTVHVPVMYGKCTVCHSSHSSDIPNQLLQSLPGLCFTCHDKRIQRSGGTTIPPIKTLFNDKGVKHHEPFKKGNCMACHFPHASTNYRLLRGTVTRTTISTFKEEENELCFSCHPGLLLALKEPRTTTNTQFRNGNMNLHYWHVISKRRTCNACHQQHGSRNDKLIRDSLTFGKKVFPMRFTTDGTGGTCASACHVERKYDRFVPIVN